MVPLTCTRASHCRPRHHDAAEAPHKDLAGHPHLTVGGAGAGPGAPSCPKTRRRKSRLAGGPTTPLAGEEADRQPTSYSQDRRQAAGTMMPPLCRGASAATKSPLTMKKPSPGMLEEHRSDRYPSGSGQLRRGSSRRPCPRCTHVLMLGVLIIHLI